MTATADAATLSAKLKDGTWDLHSAAEKQPFQQNLVRGKVSRDAYTGWLGQMLLIHRALESGLRDLVANDPRAAAVVTDEQYQEPYLLEDLGTLGLDAGDVEPLAETTALLERIAQTAADAPLGLLGFHYVLEGSNNGNAFIARAVRPALGLDPGSGDRYLDPYGERQRPLWAAFKDAIDTGEFTEAEHELLIQSARTMFGAISDLSAALPSE